MEKKCNQTAQKGTWEETGSTRAQPTAGLNLTVFGLMAVTAFSAHTLEGDTLMAPASNSEKDLKEEQLGLEATGLAITVLSASLTSIL